MNHAANILVRAFDGDEPLSGDGLNRKSLLAAEKIEV
jgi:hypothetical protein